jgi:hypothetical protein
LDFHPEIEHIFSRGKEHKIVRYAWVLQAQFNMWVKVPIVVFVNRGRTGATLVLPTGGSGENEFALREIPIKDQLRLSESQV